MKNGDAEIGGRTAITRRGFLGVTAFGLAGAITTPAVLPATAFANEQAGRQTGRVLLRGGTVLSIDPAIGELSRADVLIADGTIERIEERVQDGTAEVIDARGMIVMPGFIDTHRHMWQGLLRNIGPDDLLSDYLSKVLFGFAPQLTPEEVYLGNLVTALSALNAGITTIFDWSHIATTPAHTDAAIAALREARIRAVYGYGPNFGLPTPWYADPQSAYPEDLRRLRTRYFSSSDQLLTLALAAAGPEFANVDAAVREWTIAREVGARISVHIGVGRLASISGSLQALAARVPLGDDTTYIHCSTLTDSEWELIAATGGTVSLAVPIEMQMGHGMPPIQKALDRGIRPSLSIDVETNQPTDMFTQMRTCFALQRMLVNEPHLFPDEPDRSRLLTVRDVLQFATIEGARANGLAHKTGSLTPGKEADIILLRTDAINVAPVNNAAGAVVLGMDSSNVDSVFVAGRAVKRRGELVGVNMNRLVREAERVRDRIRARVGI
jgi:cytosine/adenosine deaminase-related metal-dependent hydrolase